MGNDIESLKGIGGRKMLKRRLYTYVIFICLLPLLAFGEVVKIELPVSETGTKKAFFISPKNKGKSPAIVYMHGGIAREKKDYRFFKDKILDYASLGFVVLAHS